MKRCDNRKEKVTGMRKTAIVLLLIFCFSLLPFNSTAATASTYEDYAECLSKLGVFVGTGNGFELDRAPTRIEGLVMLIRLLGAETEAKTMQGKTLPFTDVPKWASGYVAYAYENGLTNGIGKTMFGPANTMEVMSYVTFLLRSLGYNDQAGDFSYNNSLIFSNSINLINDSMYSILSKEAFLRAHLAKTSYDTLRFPYKGENIPLIDKLVSENKIDKATGETFKKTVLSEPSELSAHSSPPIDMEANLESVVMLSCYTAYTDEEYGPDIGSGVIISSDGKIVTNYHVLEDVSKIKVTFNNESVYEGNVYIMDYDEELDLAVLKINKSRLKHAVIGDSSKVKTGDPVVSIGSPYGLINTVTERIVSAIRSDSIQISAAINPGNSGGGLFDKDGKLIGIPNASIFLADNMGFAIPVNQLSAVSENKSILLEDYCTMNTKPLPPAPTELHLVYETGTMVLLNWNPVKDATYYIYCKEEGDDDYYYLDEAYYGDNYGYLAINLIPGNQYSFKVSAELDEGESKMSSALTFTKSTGIHKAGPFDLFYSGFPAIPDFGKLAGADPYKIESNVYYYNIYVGNLPPVLIGDYVCLLDDCGFLFESASQAADGTVTGYYENEALDKSVTLTAKAGADELWVNIKIEN